MLTGRRAQAWRHQPAFRRPRHFHDEPEINVVVAGSGLLGVGDRTIRVSAGETLVFQPGQDHVLLDSSPDFDLFVLALRPELAERAVGLRALAAGRSATLASADARRLTAELGGLTDVIDATATETRLADLFRGMVRNAGGAHVVTRRAVELARTQPGLAGSALARVLRTAPSVLSRQFHVELGVPLVEYRARTKLMHFVELVDAGALLTRAALEADFGSYAQCHRVFRRALGCSPRAYFAGGRARVDEATAD
jgi:AraC-like DNA-binding protein